MLFYTPSTIVISRFRCLILIGLGRVQEPQISESEAYDVKIGLIEKKSLVIMNILMRNNDHSIFITCTHHISQAMLFFLATTLVEETK